MDPTAREPRLAYQRRAGAQELLVGDVGVIDVEQTAEEPDDSDGGHDSLRDTTPPSLARAVPPLPQALLTECPGHQIVSSSPSTTMTSAVAALA